jgi:peptide/nickel transport system permease protein
MFLSRVLRHRSALVGLFLVAFFVLLAIVGPYVAPYAPEAQDLLRTLQAPTQAHPFGTDELGRDVLSRVMHGTRVSMLIALFAVGLALVLGAALGLTAGYFRGWWDRVISQFLEVLMTIPPLVLAIFIVAILRSGTPSVIIAVAISSLPIFARLVRSVVLTLRNLDFVHAARALGSNPWRIILGHILPNAAGPILVQASIGAGTAVLTAAALSFVGLGVQPPAPEWGAMLSRGRQFLTLAPHVVVFPGVAIALLVLGFNLLGDGLRDLLDPRLKKNLR